MTNPATTSCSLCTPKSPVRGFVVSADDVFVELVRSLWSGCDVAWTRFPRGGAAVEQLFSDPPDLLLVDTELPDISGADLVTTVKAENVYRQLPVVLRLANGEAETGIDFTSVEADDFLTTADIADPNVVRMRLALTLCRSARSLDANPLTKLPGNTTIISRIQELIDKKAPFALAYADLDHFKAFNDKYGFARGDEALMMSARVIVNTVRSFPSEYSFVGHVGGDDFVFIVRAEEAEDACKRVIANFDAIVPNFYDRDDRARGAILSTDRQGQERTFPLMAVSIAVVRNLSGKLTHFGEVSHIASGLKKKAKGVETSSYVIDAREE